MLEELSKDYSNYLKIDFSYELHNVQDTVDDLLTRLDEFENLVNMVQTDGQLCADVSIPQILKCKENLDGLCDRIDRLNHFVNRVKSDMDIVETQVEEAESDVQIKTTLRKIFKPLLFSWGDLSARKMGQTPSYEPPHLFSTSSYFSSSETGKKPETVHLNF